MANNWNEMDAAQQESVRARFLNLNETRELAEVLPKASAATLYRYARNKDIDTNGSIEAALQNDDALWNDFLKILALVDVREFGLLATASSKADQRAGWDASRQWHYEVNQAPEPPFEEVLIIEIMEATNFPTRIVAESSGLQLRVEQKLDAPFRGSIQMILPEGDRLATILGADDRVIRMW